jgi:hypothetical protein
MLTVLAIPAFYLLAKETLEAEMPAALATLFFAFSPRSFSWFVMGGGLTRALGLISLLLTLYAASKLYKLSSKKNLIITIFFGGTVVLSHPEAIIHTVVAAVWLWMAISRKKSTFIDGFKVCAGVIAWTSPWWGTVIAQHGMTPLLNASQTGFHHLSLALIPFSFTEEPFMTIIPVLGIVGAFGEFRLRRFFLPGWVILSFLVDPRSAAWVANITLGMLAAVALDQIILPGLANLRLNPRLANENTRRQNWSAKLLLAYFLLYLLAGSYLYMLNISTIFLSKAHQTAMAWIKENTPPDSRFILLTPGSDYPMRDPIQEWFPALTERISLTTMQGQEWTLGPNFAQTTTENRKLQACATQEIKCLENQYIFSSQKVDFIYISKSLDGQQCVAEESCDGAKQFIKSAKSTQQFRSIFENSTALILEIEKPK